jgi:hypothetical protein
MLINQLESQTECIMSGHALHNVTSQGICKLLFGCIVRHLKLKLAMHFLHSHITSNVTQFNVDDCHTLEKMHFYQA